MNFNYEDRIIYKVLSGSRCYKTHNRNSDYDFRGVIIPPIDYFFGLKKFKQHVGEEGIIDYCYYDIRKFVKLAINGNPNIIELFFVDKPEVLYDKRLITLGKSCVLSRAIVTKHIGMASGHLKKFKRSFDNKDASHVIRVLLQCKDLLTVGKIVFGENADCLKNIKNGKWLPKEVLSYAEELIRDLRKLEDNIDIPATPDYKFINNLMQDIIIDYLTDKGEL